MKYGFVKVVKKFLESKQRILTANRGDSMKNKDTIIICIIFVIVAYFAGNFLGNFQGRIAERELVTMQNEKILRIYKGIIIKITEENILLKKYIRGLTSLNDESIKILIKNMERGE